MFTSAEGEPFFSGGRSAFGEQIARIFRHEITMATMFLITEQREYQGNSGER